MIYIIGISLALVFVLAYALGLIAMSSFRIYVIIMLAICIITSVSIHFGKKTKLSKAQKQKIQDAKDLDEKNKELNAEIGKKQAIENANLTIEAKQKELVPLLKKAEELQSELKKAWENVDAIDIIADADKDLKTITFLIEKLEGRRANSITEALLLLDAKRDKDEEERKRQEKEIARIQFETDMQILRQRQQAQRDLEEHWARMSHNRKMEDEAQRLADEAERMRKNQEYYQRYGKN